MAVPWRTPNLFYRKYLYNLVLLYKSRADLKMFLEVILSLATVSIFAVFAIRPTLLTIANLITEINTKQDVSNKLEEKINNISLAQQNMEKFAEQIAILDQSIPNNGEPQSFIRQVEGLVSKNQVNLEQIRTEKITLVGSEDKSQVKQNETQLEKPLLVARGKYVDMTISVSGSYSQLVAFLADVENTRRPFILETIGFNSTLADQGEKLIISVTGKIPYLGAAPDIQ